MKVERQGHKMWQSKLRIYEHCSCIDILSKRCRLLSIRLKYAWKTGKSKNLKITMHNLSKYTRWECSALRLEWEKLWWNSPQTRVHCNITIPIILTRMQRSNDLKRTIKVLPIHLCGSLIFSHGKYLLLQKTAKCQFFAEIDYHTSKKFKKRERIEEEEM